MSTVVRRSALRLLACVVCAIPVVILSAMWIHLPWHRFAKFLAAYSPERLLHGAVWTLPLSAFVVPHMGEIRPTIAFVLVLFVPYALLRGPLRAVLVFFLGHISSTLIVESVVVVGSALGWSTATTYYGARDMGISAGLAAISGALVVLLLASRVKVLGLLLLGASIWFFLHMMIGHPTGRIAGIEHFLALAAGATFELVARIHAARGTRGLWGTSDRADDVQTPLPQDALGPRRPTEEMTASR
jgi:hypothetical protein